MADLTPSLTQQRSTDGESALKRAVLGPAGPIRQGVKRLLWVLPAYAFAMALMVCAVFPSPRANAGLSPGAVQPDHGLPVLA